MFYTNVLDFSIYFFSFTSSLRIFYIPFFFLLPRKMCSLIFFFFSVDFPVILYMLRIFSHCICIWHVCISFINRFCYELLYTRILHIHFSFFSWLFFSFSFYYYYYYYWIGKKKRTITFSFIYFPFYVFTYKDIEHKGI